MLKTNLPSLPAFVAAAILINSSCSYGPSSKASDQLAVRFEFTHTEYNERFFAETQDAALIEMARRELAKPVDQRTLHIHGALVRGSGGLNEPWGWHFSPDDWLMAEMSMELCDSWPSYIEENLDAWIDEVGSFCPWASRIVREVD